jgi:2-polyprenyl-3-methyl-5-hydroxy-6-metoxy-1,4-benzoquinol methylase
MPAMELHGQALLDYITGEEDAHYILRRDDGIAYAPIYAKQFFYPDGFPELDRIAVEHCAGRVLDIGAGAGSHSLAIQRRGLDAMRSTASDVMVRFTDFM